MKQITFLSFFKRPVDLHLKEKNWEFALEFNAFINYHAIEIQSLKSNFQSFLVSSRNKYSICLWLTRVDGLFVVKLSLWRNVSPCCSVHQLKSIHFQISGRIVLKWYPQTISQRADLKWRLLISTEFSNHWTWTSGTVFDLNKRSKTREEDKWLRCELHLKTFRSGNYPRTLSIGTTHGWILWTSDELRRSICFQNNWFL